MLDLQMGGTLAGALDQDAEEDEVTYPQEEDSDEDYEDS